VLRLVVEGSEQYGKRRGTGSSQDLRKCHVTEAYPLIIIFTHLMNHFVPSYSFELGCYFPLVFFLVLIQQLVTLVVTITEYDPRNLSDLEPCAFPCLSLMGPVASQQDLDHVYLVAVFPGFNVKRN
jgi:hypothetical protein